MNDDSITIIPNVGGTFDVRRGARLADHLNFDEMLGLIAQMTMPDERRALSWLKTPEQIEQFEDHLRSMRSERGAGDDYPVIEGYKPIPVPPGPVATENPGVAEIILASENDAPCSACDGDGTVINDNTGLLQQCNRCLGSGTEPVAPV